MSRVKLTNSEFTIARAGFHVETASDANILFSSKYANMSIYMRGSAPLSDAGVIAPSDSSTGFRRYRRAIINFGKTFTTPPIVFCTSSYDFTSTKLNICSFPQRYSAVWDGSRVFFEPMMFWQVTTTNFTFYNYWGAVGGSNAVENAGRANVVNYLVLENTIQ